MKLGIISDIHANPFGLEIALEHFKGEHADAILCNGDLTGYSPLVNETLDLLRAQPIEFILGNHDTYLLYGCPREKNPIVQKSTNLTRELIHPDHLDFLRTLKPARIIDYADFRIKMVHGSPLDHLEDYIYPDRAIQPEELWQDNENVLILGHTHHQMLKRFPQFQLLNPGSCGQARDKRGYVCFAMLDTSNSSIQLEQVSYDTTGMIHALECSGWPEELLGYFRNDSASTLR
jgi:putative phosphoesterase